MERKKDTMTVTIKTMPVWVINRLRVKAAQKGENGYGRELVRVLEETLSEENKEER